MISFKTGKRIEDGGVWKSCVLVYPRPDVPDADRKTVSVALTQYTLNILWNVLIYRDLKYDLGVFLILQNLNKFAEPLSQV